MTLGNMRANAVRSLDVPCSLCHHRAILSTDPWPDHVPVPTFGPRMVCRRAAPWWRSSGRRRRRPTRNRPRIGRASLAHTVFRCPGTVTPADWARTPLRL
jgi:hypothetical protein